jgi:hypothetical protein
MLKISVCECYLTGFACLASLSLLITFLPSNNVFVTNFRYAKTCNSMLVNSIWSPLWLLSQKVVVYSSLTI